MTLVLAAIADDYTGASDLANTWSKTGLRTAQSIGIPEDAEAFDNIDALVISLKIRSVPARQAVKRALEADDFLRKAGVQHVMYKVCSTFDSTPEGNIGPVTDALMEQSGQEWTLVTPAFPETGRTVYKGNLFVNDLPLNESPLRNHPLNPMRDANLARVLGAQSKRPVRILDVQTLMSGLDACRRRIGAPSDAPSIIADAVSDSDLEALGLLAFETASSTGASGLGYGLAKAALRTGAVSKASDCRMVPVGGSAAAIAGSCSSRTLNQITHAEGHIPVLRLDPERIVSGQDAVEEALDFAAHHAGKRPFLISASAVPDAVASLQEKYGKLEAGRAIESSLSEIAQRLVHNGVRRLVVAGGETSGAVVDKLSIRSFEIGEELAPGVPALRTIDYPGGDLMMALKSGNFGGEDFFVDALSRLK